MEKLILSEVEYLIWKLEESSNMKGENMGKNELYRKLKSIKMELMGMEDTQGLIKKDLLLK